MKNNFLILSIFITGFLILPVFCLGAISYERNPTGYTITNPVSFDVSFDSFGEVCFEDYGNYWIIQISNELGDIDSPVIASTTFNHYFSTTLPIWTYDGVYITCCEDEAKSICNTYITLEEEDPHAFEVIVNGGKILTLPETAIASTTGTISDLFSAIGPFIWLFIGLPLAFVVISRILRIMP